MEQPKHQDIVIIGSGAGGGTLAYGLKDSGLSVLILERGEFLPREEQNYSADQVFAKERYFAPDNMVNEYDRSRSNNYSSIYWVGGKTKLYGSALLRLRKDDFTGVHHEEGDTVPWPISYDELEPYDSAAEKLYQVHGVTDPTDPPRSQPFPFPPREHDPYISEMEKNLVEQGINVRPIPLGIVEENREKIDWSKFDLYPSRVDGKSDAEVCAVKPALESKNISIMTGTRVLRLITDDTGKRVVAAEVEHKGEKLKITADRFVLAAGTFHSPALLLESRNDKHPAGLANSSGLVGKNLMLHSLTLLMCMNPFKMNKAVNQKSLEVMDYYFKGPDGKHPMGIVQMTGPMPLESGVPTGFKWGAKILSAFSVQWMVMSEDLPKEHNCVKVKDGKMSFHYQPNNLKIHRAFVKIARRLVSRKSFPFVWASFARGKYISLAHAVGTLRFGKDPKTSVLDPYCRAHDVENLYVVDACFLPSSTAVNPSLTVMAQALRVAEHLKQQAR